jgi:hypothetical protein
MVEFALLFSRNYDMSRPAMLCKIARFLRANELSCGVEAAEDRAFK